MGERLQHPVCFFASQILLQQSISLTDDPVTLQDEALLFDI
jgi:hypothetical protein